MIDVSDGATLTASSGDAIPPTLIPCAPTPGVPFFSVAYVKGLVTAPVTATFGWLFCCMYINCVVQVYAEYRAQELLSFDVDIHLYDADGKPTVGQSWIHVLDNSLHENKRGWTLTKWLNMTVLNSRLKTTG